MFIHGDGYAMAHITALYLHSLAVDRKERLEGLVPMPGEFHKRIITQGDTFNELFSETEFAGRVEGTLAHMKIALHKKDAKLPSMRTSWGLGLFIMTSEETLHSGASAKHAMQKVGQLKVT